MVADVDVVLVVDAEEEEELVDIADEVVEGLVLVVEEVAVETDGDDVVETEDVDVVVVDVLL